MRIWIVIPLILLPTDASSMFFASAYRPTVRALTTEAPAFPSLVASH
jgi:hypothetical protein